jgi:competence ComEA-like helix-hairpin-helix protein
MPYLYDELHIETEFDSVTIAALRQFDSTRIAKEVAWQEKRKQDSLARVAKYPFYSDEVTPEVLPEKNPVVLIPFNPNISSTLELQSVGIPFWLANRIVKYRTKGGEFRIKSDLSKIYGFSDSLYQELEPYIELPDSISFDRNEQKLEESKVISIDINVADAAELKTLHGIGPAFSKRIVNYRTKLGGYYHVDQLKEVYGLSDSLFLVIQPSVFVLDSAGIDRININTATVKELNDHPYITYRMAADWVAYREKNGDFLSVDELLSSGLLNESLYAKIVAYIRVQ